MAEHWHKWQLTVGHSECPHCHYSAIEGFAACKVEGCNAYLGPTAIEAMLNAAECLTAEDALAINDWMASWAYIQTAISYPVELGKALVAYAERRK